MNGSDPVETFARVLAGAGGMDEYKGLIARAKLLAAKGASPALDAAGADLPRVKHFRLSKQGNDAGMVLPRDAGRLGQALGSAGVRLVIIDPLAATLDPRLNSYKDTDVREALTPLVTAASEHDFA